MYDTKEDKEVSGLGGFPFNKVTTYDNGVFLTKEFRFDTYENERTGKFKLKGNKFILADNEDYLLEEIEVGNDSLIISNLNFYSRVYRKLNDSLKSKSTDFKFTGKKFIRNYRKWTDTIHFINDSVYVSSAWKNGDLDLMWERINHNGFDILFTDIYVPFVIKSKVRNEIYVSTFGSIKEDYTLKEID